MPLKSETSVPREPTTPSDQRLEFPGSLEPATFPSNQRHPLRGNPQPFPQIRDTSSAGDKSVPRMRDMKSQVPWTRQHVPQNLRRQFRRNQQPLPHVINMAPLEPETCLRSATPVPWNQQTVSFDPRHQFRGRQLCLGIRGMSSLVPSGHELPGTGSTSSQIRAVTSPGSRLRQANPNQSR